MFETPAAPGRAAGALASPARVEATPVTHLFFHPHNIETLHTRIRYEVYRLTTKVIDRQGDKQLRTIMAAVYADSQDPTLESAIADAGTTDAAVRALNARVVDRAVGEIRSAISFHRHYMDDIATPVPTPMPRSVFSDERKGTRVLELPVGFYD